MQVHTLLLIKVLEINCTQNCPQQFTLQHNQTTANFWACKEHLGAFKEIANLSESISILWTSLILTSMTVKETSSIIWLDQRYGKSFLQLVICCACFWVLKGFSQTLRPT